MVMMGPGRPHASSAKSTEYRPPITGRVEAADPTTPVGGAVAYGPPITHGMKVVPSKARTTSVLLVKVVRL
jgi:hypothetical protein